MAASDETNEAPFFRNPMETAFQNEPVPFPDYKSVTPSNPNSKNILSSSDDSQSSTQASSMNEGFSKNPRPSYASAAFAAIDNLTWDDDDEDPEYNELLRSAQSHSQFAAGGRGRPDTLGSFPNRSYLPNKQSQNNATGSKVTLVGTTLPAQKQLLASPGIYESHAAIGGSPEPSFASQTLASSQLHGQWNNLTPTNEEPVGYCRRGGSCLDGWQLPVDALEEPLPEDDEIQRYLASERLTGMMRIKQQLKSAAQIFKDFASLVRDDQIKFDLLDQQVHDTNEQTGSALYELRKAHAYTQRIRRRNFYLIAVLLVATVVFIFVTLPPRLSVKLTPSQT